ncbi:hypothetical protein [Streptomyces sp. NPDC101776]|uniref:hypothetical protein n=1 Tax=Streptomyces sp. NPDC101776 TaxID=3366146 RepID=UPI00380C0B86
MAARSTRIQRGGSGRTTVRATLLNHFVQEADFVPAPAEQAAGLLAREALDGYHTVLVDTLKLPL